ncbi:MAG: hypothetical protein K2O03_05625, partial [Lachnospiraceae bacterium]|nr:hypothetical protein [Lachnospiraceae bacterium]
MEIFHAYKKFLLLFCCLLLASCKEASEKETIENDVSPKPTVENGFSQKIDENGQSGDELPLNGKAFGALPVVGTEDAVYCNLPENIVNWDCVVPLCFDPLYGILYYVDYGGDYMIHAVYDGESQTVLELPGKRLFCRGGKLYFLLESYHRFKFEGAESGNIAEYDPVTGKVQVLFDKTFDSIVVYQDMIYCKSLGEAQYNEEYDFYVAQASYWFYFFDTKELVARDMTGREYALDFWRYGEYFLAATLEESKEDPNRDIRVGMELRTWDGKQGNVWKGLQPGFGYYVKDGKLCWYNSDGFHVGDIASQQEQIYPLDCQKENGRYIVVNGQLFSAQHWLADLENGEYDAWNSLDEKLRMVHDFYTDGENLYAIAG